jgi:hypothetical protein
MIFVCPKPDIWNDTYQRCCRAWEASDRKGHEPPVPLILGGWDSSDVDKQDRWQALIRWAEERSLRHLIPTLSEDDKHYVHFLHPEADSA